MLFKMNSGWMLSFFLISILILMNCSQFIVLRVYAPTPNKELREEIPSEEAGNRILWDDRTNLNENLGYHNPFVFSSRALPNQYGTLVGILNREIRNNPETYSRILNQGARIRIDQFLLRTDDSCWSNVTGLEIRMNIKTGSFEKDFYYADQIESHVTDCWLLGSSITLVPLVIYTPYVGYRGNREDQINQLGRNGIMAILLSLSDKRLFAKPPESKEEDRL